MKEKKCQKFVKGIVALVLFIATTGQGVFARENSPYFQVDLLELGDGLSLERAIINGPPTPPVGFELERTVVALPKSDSEAGVATLAVPAFNWSFGCSATSASMIAGFYDRTSYPDMYTGPTNGGLMPVNNSSWPDVVINGENRHQCPLSATRNGVDGRMTRGHVDDYWFKIDALGPDPYDGNWSEHVSGDCTGDFMKTNQWVNPGESFNSDGSTTFYNWPDGTPLPAADMESHGIHIYDGGYGLKLFYESRGYTVNTMYNQYIYPFGSNTKGFTYAQYKAEIDAGRPVMIHVEGHTMVGTGYNDSAGNLVYLHDTWDYSTHTMTWGGSYGGMDHYAVTIIKLAPGEGETLDFPWMLFRAAMDGSGAVPPEAYWGVRSALCCDTDGSGSGLLFSVSYGGVTKSSYVASCASSDTWEGYAITTPGRKTFPYTLSSPACGSMSGNVTFTLEDGKSYLIVAEWDNAVVIRVYLGTTSASTPDGEPFADMGVPVAEARILMTENGSTEAGEFQRCLSGR